jgi:hypothetical protein
MDGGSARHKAATNAQDKTNTETSMPPVGFEPNSCLRQRDHCERLMLIPYDLKLEYNPHGKFRATPFDVGSRIPVASKCSFEMHAGFIIIVFL